MKKIIIILFVFGFFSCNSKTEPKQEKGSKEINSNNIQSEPNKSTGYKLMEQKCFSCHFVKPDPKRKEQMLAPPMLKVKEHYKPNYESKEDFVKAITEWVQNPNEENTLMPGAIRKFNVMPNLQYEEKDVNLIAETLFDMDFGAMTKKNHNEKGTHKSLTLNKGKKWEIKAETVAQITEVSKSLNEFISENLDEYKALGKKVFDDAKLILMDKSYTDETFDMLHSFFNNVEGNIHELIASKDLTTAKKQHSILLEKFSKFEEYFEAKK